MIPTAMVSPAGQTHRITANIAACRRNRFPFLRLSSVNVDRTDCVASDPYSSVNVFGMISVFVFVDTSMSSYEKPIDFYSYSQLKEVGGPRIFNSAFPSWPANDKKSTGTLTSLFSLYDATVLK